MRFRVDTKELNEAISVVTKAMPAHSSMPILEGIYIYASGSSLFLKCSDLSLQIETEIAAFVEEEGIQAVRRTAVPLRAEMPPPPATM